MNSTAQSGTFICFREEDPQVTFEGLYLDGNMIPSLLSYSALVSTTSFRVARQFRARLGKEGRKVHLRYTLVRRHARLCSC